MSTENGCENTTTADGVKEHYSKRVKKGADVKSSPCSLATKVPAHVKEAISLVHDDVINRQVLLLFVLAKRQRIY